MSAHKQQLVLEDVVIYLQSQGYSFNPLKMHNMQTTIMYNMFSHSEEGAIKWYCFVYICCYLVIGQLLGLVCLMLFTAPWVDVSLGSDLQAWLTNHCPIICTVWPSALMWPCLLVLF